MSLRIKCKNEKLRNLVVNISSNTRKTHDVVSKKRNKNNIIGDISKSDCPDFSDVFCESSLDDAVAFGKKCGQRKKCAVNWFQVQGWFANAIARNNKDWLVVEKDDDELSQTAWAWKEKGCAERLLKHYGPEVVEKTVDWFCDNWQAMKDASCGKLYGAPTVCFLWSSRERIFPAAKEGKPYVVSTKKHSKRKKKHMVGEYNAESANKMPRIGFGDID